jgi:type I restriction enzyme R subunit
VDLSTLQSVNFEFLRSKHEELAALAAFAEEYAHSDPASALVKLRTFAEQMVNAIYRNLGLPRPYQPDLIQLLNNDSFKAVVPAVVLDKLHLLRVRGNKAAHGQTMTPPLALEIIRDAFDLARWFGVTFLGMKTAALPTFVPLRPKNSEQAGTTPQRESAAGKEQLLAQEAKIYELLKALESEKERAIAAEAKAQELEKASARGSAAASELDFDETTTRKRLIDAELIDAGWKVGADGSRTGEVSQEEPISGQPTATGTGYADYVLWDESGKPLAVIEAKKTATSPELGRKQSALYADGLEKSYGQRPVIFYTNGFDIWMWDDVQGYPPRKLFGFYSKDSLQYLVFQRGAKKDLTTVEPNAEITGRLYQLEALRRVTERFSGKNRKALIVQATGTGKTRVAISLVDLLLRARWIKRVLFLCDRRELRRQAKNVFTEFLPGEPLTVVGARTAQDRDKRVYMATYPAIKQIFQTFDVGFFDLIIADESHRSIYNVYGDIFRYFDCLQVGLTATPVEFVSRNTYRLFDCEDQKPTAYYALDRAVEEGHLVPFEVYTHTTQFLRGGIKYGELSEEQRRQLEDDGEDPSTFQYEAPAVDKQIFNKDTNRAVLRNLMENGIRDLTGQKVGKSIIFARSHQHAVLLRELFDEMYPQYRGKLCQVIDNYDPRAEQLIDDFKGSGNNDDFAIAISVDMLDTGIDIPEIVNLVFARPVKSKVKFWQMIGRGTRLRKDLFGPGKDKKIFRIFDHWGNFDYFEMRYKPAEAGVSKGLLQQLFEARLELAQSGLAAAQPDVFRMAVRLVQENIAALPEESIPVREKWRETRVALESVRSDVFDAGTVGLLRTEIAPLMRWIDIRGYAEAYSFDLLMALMQREVFRKSAKFQDLKDTFLDRVNSLQMNLNPVQQKAEVIRRVRDKSFWNCATVSDLEEIRLELRGIMHHRQQSSGSRIPPRIVDIKEDASQHELARRTTSINANEMKVYEQSVEEVLSALFRTNPTLQKIRSAMPVTEADLSALTSLVLTQNPNVDLKVLRDFYPEAALPLDFLIRRIVGMDAQVVKSRFESFVRRHPALTAKQVRFLGLLQNHIARHGTIERERLYDDPFTLIDAEGPAGVFSDERQITELMDLIDSFGPSTRIQ